MKISKNNLVSIIIVNYNGRELLKRCLQSLRKQTYKELEIIVVDNDSTDGTVKEMKKLFPECHILSQSKNIGFAEGNNVGYLKSTGAYIYFLNNDTTLKSNAIDEMVNILHQKDVGGVQSKLLLLEKPDTLDTIGAFLTPTGFLFHNHFGEKDNKTFDISTPLYTVKGASMMFKRKILEQVLLDHVIFDREYFAYFEETDLCHRIWLAGYQIVYAPKAVVYHVMGATSSKMDNAFVQYHSFKNRIATYIKNLEWKNFLWLISLHLIIIELYACVVFLQGNIAIFKSIQKAIAWNIYSFPKLMKKRYIIQNKIRTTSDDSLFPYLMKYPNLRYYIALFTGRAYTKNIEDYHQ